MKPVLVAKRNEQVTRIIGMIRDLHRTDGMDIYEIADKYGTVTRTVRRDLEAIQSIGVPLVEEVAPDGKRKRWRVAYEDKLAKLADLFEVGHYLALRVAMDGPVAKRSALFATLEDLSDKVADALGEGERALLQSIERAFHSYDKFAYEETPRELFWPLIVAISESRVCRVVYRAARADAKDKEIRLLPLKLFSYGGATYLHAFVPKHDSVIVLHLHRMKSMRPTADVMKAPAGYRAQSLEDSAFGVFIGDPVRFKLRFASSVATFVRERRWHSSQRLRALDDGGVELTFSCADSPEVKNWIASWRADVEVIEPSSLRAEMAALGRALAERYA